MRYALFTDKHEADGLAKEVESICSDMQPRVIKLSVWVGHLNKWAVLMEREPDLMGIEVVDSIEPVIEEPE